MSSDFFYSELPALHDLGELTDSQNFVPLPEDWYILITDITNSTEAIAAGRYKEINLMGASSIVAVLNITKGLEIPYVFGGDGASLVVPPHLLPAAQQALLATSKVAQTDFGLDLRIGVVPVADVMAAGQEIKVAKLEVSEHYSQANFTGGGLTCATNWVKDQRPDNLYRLTSTTTSEANFSGLECRWQDIFNHAGHIVSLIVTAAPSGNQERDQVYREVIQKIRQIYGQSQDPHPVRQQALNLTFNPVKLAVQTKLQAKPHFWHRFIYFLKINWLNGLGWFLMRFKLRFESVDWGNYKSLVIETTDYQKFDDMLRMIIASTPAQTEQLNQYLTQEFTAGRLVHGLHISDRALMTCLVFERNGRQVHFIDGADGGYAAAAQVLKERLHQKALNWKTYQRMANLRQQVTKPKTSSN